MWCILLSSLILRVSWTSRAWRSRHVAEPGSGNGCVDAELLTHWWNAVSLAHLQTTYSRSTPSLLCWNLMYKPTQENICIIMLFVNDQVCAFSHWCAFSAVAAVDWRSVRASCLVKKISPQWQYTKVCPYRSAGAWLNSRLLCKLVLLDENDRKYNFR